MSTNTAVQSTSATATSPLPQQLVSMDPLAVHVSEDSDDVYHFELSQKGYLFRLIRFNYPISTPNKVVLWTENLKQIVKLLNSGSHKNINLVGPSGFGKTFSLLALWHFYLFEATDSEYLPILLCPSMMSKADARSGQRFVLEYAGKSDDENYQIKDSWKEFLDQFQSDNREVLLLLEVGGIDADKRQYQHEMLFLHEFSYVTVTSFSSGESINVNVNDARFKDLQYLVRETIQCANSCIYEFQPFSKNEVEMFLKLHNQTGSINDLFEATNFVPKSVAFCAFCVSYEGARGLYSIIDARINEFCAKLMSIGRWDHNKLHASIYFLKMASQRKLLPESLKLQFNESVVSSERMVFLAFNTLYLTYPIAYYETLQSLVQEDKICKLPIETASTLWFNKSVRGARFEILFSRYVHFYPVTVLLTDMSTLSFQVNSPVQFRTLPLRHIDNQVLYYLRPGHKAIDGLFLDNDKLFMLQLSVQPYQNHKSKSNNIFDYSTPESSLKRVIEYYKELSSATQVIYIYVSPLEKDDSSLSSLILHRKWQREYISCGIIHPESAIFDILSEIYENKL